MKYIKWFEKLDSWQFSPEKTASKKYWWVPSKYLKIGLDKIPGLPEAQRKRIFDEFTTQEAIYPFSPREILVFQTTEFGDGMLSSQEGWNWSLFEYNEEKLLSKGYKSQGHVKIEDYEKDANKYNL